MEVFSNGNFTHIGMFSPVPDKMFSDDTAPDDFLAEFPKDFESDQHDCQEWTVDCEVRIESQVPRFPVAL